MLNTTTEIYINKTVTWWLKKFEKTEKQKSR